MQTYRAVAAGFQRTRLCALRQLPGSRNWCSVPWTSWRSRRRWSHLRNEVKIANAARRPAGDTARDCSPHRLHGGFHAPDRTRPHAPPI